MLRRKLYRIDRCWHRWGIAWLFPRSLTMGWVTERGCAADTRAGLCGSCINAQVVTSSRGSTFYLCRLSFTDPRFPRYPPLPVLTCAGYEPTREPANPRTREP